jgi:hypothetical protein
MFIVTVISFFASVSTGFFVCLERVDQIPGEFITLFLLRTGVAFCHVRRRMPRLGLGRIQSVFQFDGGYAGVSQKVREPMRYFLTVWQPPIPFFDGVFYRLPITVLIVKIFALPGLCRSCLVPCDS